MKQLIIATIAVCLTNLVISQSYSISYNNGTTTQWVHITIDTNYSSNSIFVDKEIVLGSTGTILQQEDLLLLGEFVFDTDSANLDYDRYNYFWFPFDPSEPFYNVDQLAGSGVHDGTMYYEHSTAMSGGGGDLTYWCDCGGHTGSNDTPGGCVSNKTGSKIRCIKEGNQCQSSCIGSFTGDGIANPGGGIIVQVSSPKYRLIHNFGSGQ